MGGRKRIEVGIDNTIIFMDVPYFESKIRMVLLISLLNYFSPMSVLQKASCVMGTSGSMEKLDEINK